MINDTFFIKRFVFFISLSTFSTVAHSNVCVDALRDRAMAVEMQNYELMILAADSVINRCEWKVGRSFGRVVADKILANAMLGRYAEGLKNANACMNNYPGFPTCLYWKAVIHRELGQKTEFDRTKKLAIQSSNYLIANESRLIAGASSKIEKIELEGDVETAKLVLQNLNKLTYR